MTPEQTILAEQIVAYALDKLRTVELQHEADPRLIFGELIGQLVAAEYKVQAGAKAEAQLVELIGAIWEGGAPPNVSHELTIARVKSLLATETERVQSAEAEAEEAAHFVGADAEEAPDG